MGFLAFLSGDGGGTARRCATATGEARHLATSTSSTPLVNVASRERRHGPSTDRMLHAARPSSLQRDAYPTPTGEARRRQGNHGAARKRRSRARHHDDGRGAARQRSAEGEPSTDLAPCRATLSSLQATATQRLLRGATATGEARRDSDRGGDARQRDAGGEAQLALDGPGAAQRN